MKVLVLMAAYNGMRYIREQLESIYAQEGVEVSLLVRDDGSSDGTQDLLQSEQEAGRLQWYTGENLRPARGFMQLLNDAPDAPLYAFSDHDDVWLSDKLRAAADAIGAEQGPALYFCQTKLVDAQLRDLPQIPIKPKLTFGEALVYQFVGGCAMVMNDALRKMVVSYVPQYLRMHDIRIYDIALAVGARVVFDATPHILYRQHGGNSVGQSRSLCTQLRERWQHVSSAEHIRLRTAQELLRGFADRMTPENRDLTARVVNYRHSIRNKWSLLFDSRLCPASRMIAFTSRLALLTNQF